MHKELKGMDKQLRRRGNMLRAIIKYKDIKALKRNQKRLERLYKGKTSKKVGCEERYIVGRAGQIIRVCIYKPREQEGYLPGVLWLHGGGYAMGLPEQDLPYYEKLIGASGCVIVAPDYARSIDFPYPAAFEDAYESLYWMKENAAILGIRTDQLFVGGESAGGGLAMAVTLCARDRGEVNIAFQMPLYPMIDDRMTAPSAVDNKAPVWDSVKNKVAWQAYLGELFGSDQVPKYAAPARETNYTRLPPLFSFIGDIEPFYDETLTYIKQLRKAGVEAHLAIYKGCYHGFDIICPKSTKAKAATKTMLAAFQHATTHYFAPQEG